MNEAERWASVDAGVDGHRVFLSGVATMSEISMELQWRRWKGCRWAPGVQSFPPEDRDLFSGPGDHRLPTEPFRIRYASNDRG